MAKQFLIIVRQYWQKLAILHTNIGNIVQNIVNRNNISTIFLSILFQYIVSGNNIDPIFSFILFQDILHFKIKVGKMLQYCMEILRILSKIQPMETILFRYYRQFNNQYILHFNTIDVSHWICIQYSISIREALKLEIFTS